MEHIVSSSGNGSRGQARPSPCAQSDRPEFDAIPALVAGFNLHSRCNYVNPRLVSWFGKPKEWFIGRHIGSLLGKDCWRVNRDHLHAALHGLSTDFQLEFPADGTSRWLHVYVSPEIDAEGKFCGYLTLALDISPQTRRLAILQELQTVTSSETGQLYFESLVREISERLDIQYAFLGERSKDGRDISLRAFFSNGQLIGGKLSNPIANTPCEIVLEGETCCFPSGVAASFPMDEGLAVRKIEAYCAVPLKTAEGDSFGLLGVMDSRPFADPGLISSALDQCAIRASAEWVRLKATEALSEESEKFRKLLDNLPRIPTRCLDEHHRINFWNKASQNLYGYTREEAIGKRIEDLIVLPEQRSEIRATINSWQSSEGAKPSSEMTLVTKAGIPVPVYSSHVLLHDPLGKPELFCLDLELSSLKSAEHALKLATERQRRLAEILEATPDIVISCDQNQRLLYANKGARRLLNIPLKGHGEATYLADIYTPEYYAKLMSQVMPQIKSTGSWSGEASLQGKESKELFVWQTLVAHKDTRASGAHLSFIMKDITQYKAKQAQLTHEQKIKVLGQLTSNIAHDFGNLLTILKGNLDLLRDELADKLDADTLELLNDSLSAAEDGSRMTRQLRLIARKKPLAPKPEDVNELIVKFQRLMSRTLGQNIHLELNLTPELPPVLIDHAQLESALLNLALNAKDAMLQGGTLTLGTRVIDVKRKAGGKYEILSPGEYLCLTITDTGHGMTEEVLKNACKPFFTTKQDGRGTGLGLSLIFNFMQELGGLMLLESTPNKGTSIELLFPTKFDQPKATASIADKPTSSSLLKFCRVLAVDDDPAVLRYAVVTMKRQGYEVIEASDAASALQILANKADQIDLLFTDIIMPGIMNGVELAQAVNKKYPKIKVLLTTAAEPDSFTNPANMFPLLKKPYSPSELIDFISRVIR